ncbi:Uncharacterized protein NEOC65_001500 [Neochlamydia sp. AcF65]|nr:Uncharacterized protein [Neochlamydia sp. AcF65]MBS4169370.1 Uncharacterized protein [Neochlamydia sp. AcF95]
MGMAINVFNFLVAELALPAESIQAVIKLLTEGNTIPFISRYRKEVTGNLDEVQIRAIQERYNYLLELEERKKSIIESVELQGKMTDSLKIQIQNCFSKAILEDLYLPYKLKKRTKAALAKEKGLEPFALRIMEQPIAGHPLEEATAYIDAKKGVSSIEEVLAGALDIVADSIATTPKVRAYVRECFENEGVVVSRVVEGKESAASKYEVYYAFQEKVSKIPSHRYLAIRRGEKEEILNFHIEVPEENLQNTIKSIIKYNSRSPFAELLEKGAIQAFKRYLLPSVETEIKVQLKMQSDRTAIEVFAENLRHRLLDAPLGPQVVIGIDPGFRTGCKCVVIDKTGKFIDYKTIYPFQSTTAKEQAREILLQMINTYPPYAIGVGNGTAGRETEAFVQEVLTKGNLSKIILLAVNEAGASVYSASDIAREEFPELDVTIRGAISIARRLQDPLAELVKVDPQAIGVGQYQHDVNQPLLKDKLHEVVESCVNHVGVELNTASAALLSYVAGIGPQMALKIVKHREAQGPFKGRKDLKNVPGFGARTFEQSAGFLRVRAGEHPLDGSAVHPERYEVVEHIAKDIGVPLNALIGNENYIHKIEIKRYISGSLGEPTLKDIIAELQKPGRDPRETFEKLQFRHDVKTIQDLKNGMILEGIVTNVAAFGVFIDIGVHQDGFIHISELADRYVRDPSEVVHVGKRLKVRVLAVEVDRKRISLTARTGEANRTKKEKEPVKKEKKSFSSNPFANL